jgi:hypothetical protein
MSRLTDLYKRVMYGQAGMYGNHAEKSGLFGTGGEKTGGLIDFNKMNNQPGGLLQNIPETALLGSAIFGQGMKGIDPFSALFPAVTQTAQLQKYMTPELTKPTFETFKKGDVVKTINTSTREGLAEATKLTDGGYTKFSQSVQGASISDLQKGTKATAEKELKSGLFLLDDLNLIEAAYSPEFSTIEGKAKFKLLAAKDKIAPASMSSLDKQYLSSFGVWDANSQQYFNRYRKEITGVAAGEKEIGYLKNSIPSDTDSPSIYIAKLKNQKKIQERLNNSATDFLKVGSGSVYTTLQDGSRQYSEEFLNHVKENKVPPTGEEIKNILEAYKIDRGYEYKQAKQFLDIEYKGVNWEDILNNYIKIK